ncbi:hypothetical protein LWI29_033161 [Acer saccharum]|uniref:RNase H type-1 domain-containing protein n=1 Tax=Acer saccharum TaxID=4024 RepID=A0AA39RT24_ACESA|nr:hypothetical protein LWI29_033161 [Acer saccharum]
MCVKVDKWKPPGVDYWKINTDADKWKTPGFHLSNKVDKWKPPGVDYWKINIDVGTCYNNRTIGLGIIIRDKSGMVKVANSLKPKAMFSPIIAEAMAVWIAADWSRDGDLGPRGECNEFPGAQKVEANFTPKVAEALAILRGSNFCY